MKIKLEFTDEERDGKFHIKSSYCMPCGHVIRQAVTANEKMTEDEKKQAIARLNYWFEDRIKWHDCERVALKTPSGTIPNPERDRSKPAKFAYLVDNPATTKEKPHD